MATQPNRKPMRLSHGPIQSSQVAPQHAARMRTNGVYKYSDALAEIGTFVADNWGYVTFPVGAYTYRLWNIMFTASAEIAGKTDNRDGVHVVKTANIAEYVDTLIIEINGQAKWEMKAAELIKLNAYQNLDTSEGVMRIAFGSPNIHNTDLVEDAYQFGTGGIRSVKLRVKTKATWPNGMKIVVGCEYAPVVRPIGYWQTTTRYAYTPAGSGNFSITDLAVGIDWSTMWVQGAGIKDAALTVDRETVFEASNYQIRALHEAWGKDVASLGAGLMIDNFRDGDGVGFDSVVNSPIERSRGADVRLDMTMAAGGSELVVIVFHCGLFHQQ